MSQQPGPLPPRAERWFAIVAALVAATAALIGACAGCGGLFIN